MRSATGLEIMAFDQCQTRVPATKDEFSVLLDAITEARGNDQLVVCPRCGGNLLSMYTDGDRWIWCKLTTCIYAKTWDF